MDPNLKSVLDRIIHLEEENNRLLRKLHRAHQWKVFISVFYWAVIIGLSFGAYYFIQPYLEQFGLAYDLVKVKVQEVQHVVGGIASTTTSGPFLK